MSLPFAIKVKVDKNMLIADRDETPEKPILFQPISQIAQQSKFNEGKKKRTKINRPTTLEKNNYSIIKDVLNLISKSETLKKYTKGARQFLLAVCRLDTFRTTKPKKMVQILKADPSEKSFNVSEILLKVKSKIVCPEVIKTLISIFTEPFKLTKGEKFILKLVKPFQSLKQFIHPKKLKRLVM